MGASYGQFCPVAKAMELLDERWTMLVVRELISGSTQFNELRRGVPRMSPSLLSTRLNQLARAGLVEKESNGTQTSYRLTDAGRDLQPVVEAIGAWGVQWIGELGDADLDPKLLMWDIHRNVRLDLVPPGRTVVEFVFSDCAPRLRRWWLVITPDGTDVCDADPGFPVAVTVTATLRELTRVWLGEVSWRDALRGDSLELVGSRRTCRELQQWLRLSVFAGVERPASRNDHGVGGRNPP